MKQVAVLVSNNVYYNEKLGKMEEILDVDECARGEHHCSPTQICKNGQGYYSCQCPAGHHFNRITKVCEDLDECIYKVSYMICYLTLSLTFDYFFSLVEDLQTAQTLSVPTNVRVHQDIKRTTRAMESAMTLMSVKKHQDFVSRVSFASI